MKVLKLFKDDKSNCKVSSRPQNWLAANHEVCSKSFENIKAVLEIRRIINGVNYTAEDVWRILAEETSFKETER